MSLLNHYNTWAYSLYLTHLTNESYRVIFLMECLFIVSVMVNWYTDIYLDTNYYILDILSDIDLENIKTRL